MRFASCALADRRFAALVDGEAVRPLRGLAELGADSPADVLADPPLSDDVFGLDEVELLPVVPNPGKVICVGYNYKEHVSEVGRELPEHPVLFAKFADSLIGANAPIAVPPESSQVDYEAELAVVIGRTVRRLDAADALGAVAGYTIANDVTVRDFQLRTPQWLPGKAWTGMTPLGPLLVSADEVGDPHALDIRLVLNGTERQASNTSLLIFDIPHLLATISRFATLNPGDVVLTGTPGGVGFRRDPQIFLTPGDEVCVEVSKLGTLRNPVVAEPG